mgnify:CR=1 FL=1
MKKKIKCMILVLCLIIFTIVTYKVVTNENIYIDDIVYNFMSDNVINDKITNIVEKNNCNSVQFSFNIIIPNKNVTTTFALEIDDVIATFPYLVAEIIQ